MTRENTSIRRSEVGKHMNPMENIPINDDEEERREARRRTLMQTSIATDSPSLIKVTDNLKECLQIFNDNKISRENAWNLSVIDTLTILLDKHHKSLNNFRVACSSLEASSRVYAFRVDSVYTDVLRMSAELNARQYMENLDDESNANDENESVPTETGNKDEEQLGQKKKPKRPKKPVSTITKNIETLNAELDTIPLPHPIFGKQNATVGSINSSDRLLNNILLSIDSELCLRTNFMYMCTSNLETYDSDEPCYMKDGKVGPEVKIYNVTELLYTLSEENCLRPVLGDYVISNTPASFTDYKDYNAEPPPSPTSSIDNDLDALPMAFDINAECEPMPTLAEHTPIIDENNIEDFTDFTADDLIAINNCRGLLKRPVLIEDLRPIDSTRLEYSYRPLDKISKFWAGPSYWKIKKNRPRSTLLQQGENCASQATNSQREKKSTLLAKKSSKHLTFSDFHDHLFIELTDKYKMRAVNYQKKWDSRKLKLPTDLQLDAPKILALQYAPNLLVQSFPQFEEDCLPINLNDSEKNRRNSNNGFDDHFDDGGDVNNMWGDNLGDDDRCDDVNSARSDEIDGNHTILEIGTIFENAPNQVKTIFVPFAKQAKVIDMKNLKRSCATLITKQFNNCPISETLSKELCYNSEKYTSGVAKFQELYTKLPDLLSSKMAESISPSIALYSILHLANDNNYRLFSTPDLKDFWIRQITANISDSL